MNFEFDILHSFFFVFTVLRQISRKQLDQLAEASTCIIIVKWTFCIQYRNFENWIEKDFTFDPGLLSIACVLRIVCYCNQAIMSSMRKVRKSSVQMNRELEFEWDSVNMDIWVMLFLSLLCFINHIYSMAAIWEYSKTFIKWNWTNKCGISNKCAFTHNSEFQTKIPPVFA